MVFTDYFLNIDRFMPKNRVKYIFDISIHKFDNTYFKTFCGFRLFYG